MGKLFPSTGKLLENMKAAGVEPSNIDSIIITHAHPDHIGGNLDETGKPLYPNAKYTIWKAEWEFWSQGTASERVPQMFFDLARKNLTPIEDRLTLLDHEMELLPGISAIAAPGHTPGHMAVLFTSGNQSLLHISDTVLYPLHLEHPNWLPVYDIQPERAAVSKQRIFDRAANDKVLVFAHHFPPFPNLGYVMKRDYGWQWQPIEIPT
jgi:glyoxylase-like metal-dependent hydrolase (beta-lactamase superfamily II)